jgi:hypothetical protein
MPIQRFGLHLVTLGQFDEYMDLLRCAHRDENVGSVMCQTLVNVDWRGYLYNCDFGNGPWPIVVGEHCYGCTAGQGSSCGGALTS